MTLDKRVQAFVDALTQKTDFVAPFEALVADSKDATPVERDAAIAALLAWQNDHAELTGYACVASGALVEDGGSTLIGLDTILDRLADGAEIIAAAGPALDDADLDAEVPPPTALERDQRRWVAGWKLHVRGAMARLARDVAARERARAHPRLAPAMRALSARRYANHLYYIEQIIDMLDDAPLHVIDLCNGGALLRYRVSGVRNGFHLMTLLDGGDPFAIAEGGDAYVAAKHTWYTWPALAEVDGAFVTRGLGALLWGEPPARDLPQFADVRTVIRAPLGMQRSWGVSARPSLSRIAQAAYTLTKPAESP